MTTLQFTIELDPRPKKRPKVYRWSTVNPSEEDEAKLAEKFKTQPNCPSTPFSGQIRVQFKFYRNPPKNTPKWKIPLMDKGYLRPNVSPDLDNYVKLILDALNGILWEDDRYIVEMHSAKFYTSGPPKIEIFFEHFDPPEYKADAEEVIAEYQQIANLDQFFNYGNSE